MRPVTTVRLLQNIPMHRITVTAIIARCRMKCCFGLAVLPASLVDSGRPCRKQCARVRARVQVRVKLPRASQAYIQTV